eukprot:CAMPEP_0183718762 /NCGR_PEP_ID=MMETSP0737-20130205/11935_1 /TAXON_ID=385413 /ORGANISM="Thalassiosira miniscula, Strain CCMP1093" /LENGTH=423 /DNA_ID=CAMNT_0025948377 /DNA_START=38 /DNA_END=1309 /DNA_ORIENTATION=+
MCRESAPDTDSACQIPKMVTVSETDELLCTLRERDDEIAILKKELTKTRRRLATSKAVEDRLYLALNKMALELANATKITTSEIQVASNNENTSLLNSQPSADLARMISVEPLKTSRDDIIVAPIERSSKPWCESLGGKYLIPKSIKSHTRRKRNIDDDLWERLNLESCASGLNLHNLLHPGPSPCGQNLLNCHKSKGSAMPLSELVSSSSVGQIPEPAPTYSLKRRKSYCDSSLDLLNSLMPTISDKSMSELGSSTSISQFMGPRSSLTSLKRLKSEDIYVHARKRRMHDRTQNSRSGSYSRQNNEEWPSSVTSTTGLNSSSCSSGINLLSGLESPGTGIGMSASELGSSTSISQILGLGSSTSITAHKRQKNEGGNVHAGQWRMNDFDANGGSYSRQKNEDWSSVTTSSSHNMFFDVINKM